MPSVLIVDDHEENRYMLQALLTGHGYSVQAAANGAEALAQAARQPPDLLITDILMPGMDGFTLCRHWKQDPVLQAIPLVFYTATYTDPKDAQFALSLGADRFIAKPTEPDIFIQQISEVLDQYQSGALAPAHSGEVGEEVYLQSYNAALIRKLEQKMTQIEAANRALQVSEARYRTLFESAYDAIFLIQDGEFVDCNRRALELFGRQRAELIGHGPAEFSPPYQPSGQSSADYLSRWTAAALAGAPQFLEWQLWRPDGSPFDVEVNLNRIDVADGPLLLAIVRDVTARKQAEDQLRASEERLHSVVTALPDLVKVLDAEGRYVEVLSSSANFLYQERDAQQLPGRLIGDVLPAPTAGPIVDAIQRTIATGVTQALEYRLDVRGEERWFECRTGPLSPNVNGKPAVVLITRDITERKRAETHFLQAQRMEAIGRLTAGIAHDFNNMLTVINGNSSLLLELLDEASVDLRPDLQQIQQAGERAASLTRQLLAFSRKQVLQPEILHLNRVIAGMESMLRRLIGEDIQLTTALQPDLWPIKMDPAQIEQVLINLAANARDAMPRGGQLTIETANVGPGWAETPDQHVLLAISDNGSGIPEDTQAHIFEPFFTTKEAGKGTGLGLAAVYGIVTQSGGHIAVASTIDQGTTFKLYLPCAAAEHPQERPATPSALAPSGQETILVVEDDPGVRRLVRHVLQGCGYTVLEADSAQAALHMAAGHPAHIHMLVSDVVLPDLNGTVLAQQLTQQRPNLKILLMSGYTDEAISRHGGLVPEATFLPKPFDMQSLARTIRAVLDAPAHDRPIG